MMMVNTKNPVSNIIYGIFHIGSVLQTLVIALGAGLCIWGGINLLEGYGNDNPDANVPGAWRSNE